MVAVKCLPVVKMLTAGGMLHRSVVWRQLKKNEDHLSVAHESHKGVPMMSVLEALTSCILSASRDLLCACQ